MSIGRGVRLTHANFIAVRDVIYYKSLTLGGHQVKVLWIFVIISYRQAPYIGVEGYGST